jgi:hypothetical protein
VVAASYGRISWVVPAPRPVRPVRAGWWESELGASKFAAQPGRHQRQQDADDGEDERQGVRVLLVGAADQPAHDEEPNDHHVPAAMPAPDDLGPRAVG